MDDVGIVFMVIMIFVIIFYLAHKISRKIYVKSLGNNFVNFYKIIYIKGCSNIYDAGFKAAIYIFTDFIHIQQIDKGNNACSIEIPVENIVDVNFSTKESIGDTVTVPRIFLGGLFAFAFKKTKINVVKYVTISYENEENKENIVIQVEDSDSLIRDIKEQI